MQKHKIYSYKSNQLFLKLNAVGEPPFQAQGSRKALRFLVLAKKGKVNYAPFDQQIFTVYRSLFLGTVIGVPKEFASLILIAIDQTYPYDVTIGILDTVIWADNMIRTFWVEMRDRDNMAGNVTINVSKSTCSKSQDTDKSLNLRGELKVVQSTFVIKHLPEEQKIDMILLVTNSVYSVFNGIDALK